MDIKLIAIDLDGTLLDSERNLSQENYQAIQEAKKAGIQVVLCTGRPLRSMNYLLDALHLKEAGDLAITYNGGLIQETNTGNVIHEITFNREDCLDIYKLSQELNLPVNFIDLDYIYEPPYPVGVESLYMKRNINIPSEQALRFTDLNMEEVPDPFSINTIIMSRPAEELDAAFPKIPDIYFEKYNIHKSASTLLEFTPKKVNKGYAMRVVGEMLDLNKDQIMGIGDQDNDFYLLKNAGLGVAMENGVKAVKEVADYITTSNDEHGVAHAIRKFVLN